MSQLPSSEIPFEISTHLLWAVGRTGYRIFVKYNMSNKLRTRDLVRQRAIHTLETWYKA